MSDKPTYKISPLDQCPACGCPANEMEETTGSKWIMFRIPNTLFVVYQCPFCNMISGNKFAVENTQKVLKDQEEAKNKTPIYKPQGNLILPNNFRRNN